jgi:hypothetical protein
LTDASTKSTLGATNARSKELHKGNKANKSMNNASMKGMAIVGNDMWSLAIKVLQLPIFSRIHW